MVEDQEEVSASRGATIVVDSEEVGSLLYQLALPSTERTETGELDYYFEGCNPGDHLFPERTCPCRAK